MRNDINRDALQDTLLLVCKRTVLQLTTKKQDIHTQSDSPFAVHHKIDCPREGREEREAPCILRQQPASKTSPRHVETRDVRKKGQSTCSF